MNALFDGTNAANINVADAVREDPRLLAASIGGELGDGGNAGRLSVLGAGESALFSNTSIEDYHDRMINDLAVEAASAGTALESASAVYEGLSAQREAISGVSLDEEAIKLSLYERSFQGASRYVNVVNELTDVLMNIVP